MSYPVSLNQLPNDHTDNNKVQIQLCYLLAISIYFLAFKMTYLDVGNSEPGQALFLKGQKNLFLKK